MEFTAQQNNDVNAPFEDGATPDAALEDDFAFDLESSEQNNESTTDTDEQIVETMGGSNKFVLKWNDRKPGLYIRITKKVKDDFETYGCQPRSPIP